MTRYELLDRIGVGGMAEIFRGKAVAAGGFEKPVAIKRILPHLSQDRRFVELLIAEAKVLSLLKHRNIVQIFDVGLGDDGQYFLVMEYVDGKDIGAVQRFLETKRRRLPFDLALHIGAEICEALEHAHVSRGPDGKPMSLVHRDVSPSNVLLSRAGEVKLTDFGIAKRAESDATQGGAVRGKFAYISPEQARNEPLDPRSDVFSVGILMWELVCNRRLFSGLDDLAALRAVREPVIPRPTEIDPRLPPEIDQILLSALSKDKTRRFAGCGALGQKLRSLRYSLEVTVGDPATELAKIIESTEELERQSSQRLPAASRPSGRFDFEGTEATVIRIHTADAFSARDNDQSISKARMVIDRFEEEETRQAQLTGDQLRMLRGGDKREPDRRMRRDSEDELTRAREPIDLRKLAPDDSFEPSLATPTDNTKLIVSRDRRTPQPLPGVKPAPRRQGTVPPPMPVPARPAPQAPPQIATPVPVGMAPMPMPPPQSSSMLPPQSSSMLPPQSSMPSPLSSTMPPQMPQSQMPPQLAPQSAPPYMPSQPAGGYQSWGPQIAAQIPPRDATPTTQDAFDRPAYPPRPSMPQVAGFQRSKRTGINPWVLIVGALLMAALAFAITRAFIS